MVYSTFADCSKWVLNRAIEGTFPSNSAIAAISGYVGWHMYRWGEVYGPGYAATVAARMAGCTPAMENATDLVSITKCYAAYHGVVPILVPEISPYISLAISIGCSCLTSIVLNLIAMAFFKIRSCCASPLQEQEQKQISPCAEKEIPDPAATAGNFFIDPPTPLPPPKTQPVLVSVIIDRTNDPESHQETQSPIQQKKSMPLSDPRRPQNVLQPKPQHTPHSRLIVPAQLTDAEEIQEMECFWRFCYNPCFKSL